MLSPKPRFPLSDSTNLFAVPELGPTKTPTLPKSRSRIQQMAASAVPADEAVVDGTSQSDEFGLVPDVLSTDWVPNYESLAADEDEDEAETAHPDSALLIENQAHTEALLSELEDTRAQLEGESAARQALEKEAAALRERVALLEQKDAEATIKMEELHLAVESMALTNATWEQTRAELQGQLKTAQTESEETENAFNALHERYEQLKKIHAVAAKAILKLQRDIQTAQAAREKAEQECAAMASIVNERTALVQREKLVSEAALQARIMRMEVQLESAVRELALQSEQAAVLQKVCDELGAMAMACV